LIIKRGVGKSLFYRARVGLMSIRSLGLLGRLID